MKNLSKKILFITSSFEAISFMTADAKNKQGEKTTDSSHYPLGLAYLHSYLENEGHEVQTLFLNNHDYQYCFAKVKNALADFQPDIIGFQILTANRTSSFNLIEYAKENYPETQIIIGGIHTTIMHEQIIQKFPYVIAILGEGEITVSQLILELSKPDPDLNQIDGIVFMHHGEIVKTNPRQLIKNLDELPFPKHELFFDKKRTSGGIITSRGCPFKCSFCCLDVQSQRIIRKRSVANIIAEIEMMIKRFPQMTKIWIHDDSFFIDNDRVIDFCDEIIKRQIKIDFTCSARVKPISQKMVDKLEAANFKKILLGLESGDEGILKNCHKGINQSDVIKAFKMFAQTNMDVTAFLIIGLPGETKTTVRETANFVKKLQRIKYIYYENCSLLTIYPGTEVYEIAKAGGVIDDNFWLTDEPTPLYTLENSQEQLFRLKKYLLKHICLTKFFTPTGLAAQFTMTPYVIKYLFSHKNMLISLAIKFTKYILPEKIFLFLKKSIIRSPADI
jgi:anaerobic magnesium-protoporphyrin IX monomethyl ester cyclase